MCKLGHGDIFVSLAQNRGFGRLLSGHVMSFPNVRNVCLGKAIVESEQEINLVDLHVNTATGLDVFPFLSLKQAEQNRFSETLRHHQVSSFLYSCERFEMKWNIYVHRFISLCTLNNHRHFTLSHLKIYTVCASHERVMVK